MKSPSVVLPAGVQVPRVRHAPHVRANAWEDISDLAKAYNLILDPWQENVLEAAMGERSDGTWAAKHVGLSCPRQNGKGAVIEALELAALLLFGEQMIVHSAHEVRTAQLGFQRIKAYFENYDDLRKKVANIGNAVAREYIRFRNGQELRFVTRSKSAIRGFTADRLLLDEAQILTDQSWEAILYTVSARPNHQIWLIGTPPPDMEEGIVFDRFRNRGLEGKDQRFAWCEYSAPDGCDLDDPEAWAAANPALGLGRLTHSTVLDEREAASDEGFARERLGMWSSAGSQRIISAQSWDACALPFTDSAGEVSISIDVSPDRSIASMAAAGWTSDGVPFVDVVETRRGEADWGIQKFVDMVERHHVRAVVIDRLSAANSLIDPLEQRGIAITATTATQMAKAFGGFYDAVMDGQLRHLNQTGLNTALAVARKRTIGDGGFGWSRKDSESDITPLVASTLALWGLTSSEVNQPKKRTGKATFV